MKASVELNKIYNENCLDTMSRMPDGFVDLTVTSPPYDNLRDYKGYSFDFEPIAQELFRVTKKGGVVVWIVNDATIKGSETGTSFKQALYFKEVGFRLHDTMIWDKRANASIGSMKRYACVSEFMFVLSRGGLKTANIIKDKPNKRHGEVQNGSIRQKNGETRKTSGYGKREIAKYGRRHNIWSINPEKSQNNRFHPAQFSEQLANDHIISWSNEGDTVYDPFMGSGTTAKMAMLNGRNYIGSELAAEYCQIAEERITKAEAGQ